jgi:hypothetical protein
MMRGMRLTTVSLHLAEAISSLWQLLKLLKMHKLLLVLEGE